VTNIKELLNYSAFYFSGRASDRNGIISVDSFTKLITGKIGASPASKVALGWSLKRSMDWRQYSTVVNQRSNIITDGLPGDGLFSSHSNQQQ
ncbi:MAG TPA: hypothetical protein PKN37_07915, partial [Mesotoga sp.]|nr:hypothetical protein [Mesotoga sp.]